MNLTGLLTSAGFALWGRAQAAALALLGFEQPEPNQNLWGLFLDREGKDPIEFPLASVIACDVRNDSSVVSAPVEQGSFASYNKVDSPLEVTLSVALAGSESELQQIMHTLAELKTYPVLFAILTPDTAYFDLTLATITYQRKREDGIGVTYADLAFLEVRQVEARYANVEIPKRKDRGLQQAGKGKGKEKSVSILKTTRDKVFSQGVF